MDKFLQCVLPGCCSSADGQEAARLSAKMSLEATRALSAQVASLEEKLESLECEVDELTRRYSTAPVTPARGRSPLHLRPLLRSDDNYLPALMELLESSRNNTNSRSLFHLEQKGEFPETEIWTASLVGIASIRIRRFSLWGRRRSALVLASIDQFRQVRVVVTTSKVHLLTFLPKTPEFFCVSVLLNGQSVATQPSAVTLRHPDLAQAVLLDLNFLRFKKTDQSRKRFVCGITSRGRFLMVQPNGRVVLADTLTGMEGIEGSGSIVPIYSRSSYTKRLFICFCPGKVAMFSKSQLIRMRTTFSIDSDYTLLSFPKTADCLLWSRIRTIFHTREIVVLAHNSTSSLSEYALPTPEEAADIGISDLLKVGLTSLKSRFFRSSSSSQSSRTPASQTPRLLSSISDPPRVFEKAIRSGDLAAGVDRAGRVWVLDLASFCVIRMLKGYRGGEIAWHGSGQHLNLVVYLPSRRLLDVWRMRTGLRCTRFRVSEEGRILSFLSQAYFLTESGKVLSFAQSEEGLRPSFFYDSAADPMSSAARHQRDKEAVSEFIATRNGAKLLNLSVENLGLLLPLVTAEWNRSGEEYMQLILLTIKKTETLVSHPNKLVFFKTIKADLQANQQNCPNVSSLDALLSDLHTRKRLCRVYCDLLHYMKECADTYSPQAHSHSKVLEFLTSFHISISLEDEFVDARSENEVEKLCFERWIYLTSWKRFYRMTANMNSAEDSLDSSLMTCQTILWDFRCFDETMKRIGATPGTAIEMFLTWVSNCDVKQLILCLIHSEPAIHWVASLFPAYSSQLQDFIIDCPHVPGAYVLTQLCTAADSGNSVWMELAKDLAMLRNVSFVFGNRGIHLKMTLKEMVGDESICRAVARWELGEGDLGGILEIERKPESHIGEQIRPMLSEKLEKQLNASLYAIHRADILLSSAKTLTAYDLQLAQSHIASIPNQLLSGATLHYLYKKHIAPALHQVLESPPNTSDLPASVLTWLTALGNIATAEGSLMQIRTDSLISKVSSSWLDIKTSILVFNLDYLQKVLQLMGLNTSDQSSCLHTISKVFGLTETEIEELIYLNLPAQAITADPEMCTQLYTSLVLTGSGDAQLLSSLLTTDEESLTIASIKGLLETGHDAEADSLIEQVKDTVKLGEAMYSVAKKRIAFVVQTFQGDPKYALLLSNFPPKLMKMMSEDTSHIEGTSLLAAKDLISRSIRYMDSMSSVSYNDAVELEDAFMSLYKLAC